MLWIAFIYFCLIALLFFGVFGYGVNRITGFTGRSWPVRTVEACLAVIFLSGGAGCAYTAFRLYLFIHEG